MTKIASDGDRGDHGIDRGEVARGRGQVEPDDGDHRAGDQRRHETVDPARAGQMDDQPDQGVDDTGRDDAAERESNAVGSAAGRCRSGDRRHRPDEGEARAEVARHRAADEGEEDQGADAGEEDGQVGVEPHQDRRDDRGAEHGQHVLEPHRDRLTPGQPFVRIDDPGSRLLPGQDHRAPPRVPRRDRCTYTERSISQEGTTCSLSNSMSG